MRPEPPPGAPGPVWRLNPLVELHWKSWGPTWLIFEAVSGETAVLDALDAALLGCFDAQPLDFTHTAQALASALGRPPAALLAELPQEQLLAALDALVARGWLDAYHDVPHDARTGPA